MAKKVTPANIAEWRRLRAEGKAYSQIGKLTGWQGRTIRKHLFADIRSDETQSIRRELFKERLGRHWDMLIEGVLMGLGPTGVISPQDVLRALDSPESTPLETGGLRIEVSGEKKLSVEALARNSTEWALLGQHIPADPLWSAVGAYERAVSTELKAYRDLERSVAQALGAALAVPVEDQVGETPSLAAVLIRWAYAQVVLPEGQRQQLADEEVIESSSGQMKVRDVSQAALLPGRKGELVIALNTTISKKAQSDLGGNALSATQRTQRSYLELRRVMDHTRLLTYLPGVCEVCVRIEV